MSAAPSAPPDRPRWHAGAEALGILALVGVYSWALRGRGPSVAVIVLLVLYSHWRRGETPAHLGFGRAGFMMSVRRYGPVVVLLALWIGWGAMRRGVPAGMTPGRMLAILGGYCAWGLVQQWALNGYFVNRFGEAFGARRHGPLLAALAGAVCFAGAHLPNVFLVGPTFVLGFLAALAYQRQRNLLFLGLAHGVLGAVLVITVAGSLPQGLRTGGGALRGRPRPVAPVQVR